ncbi:TPA: hypothetical protein U1V47_001111 [Streptococcus suis]|uniref:hypothetical protein n=1 Tax=Streptococcus TaxID=1301 RepID=UPI0009446871|nr:hypothetical protein [Streptococcus suis]AXI67348.1 hypothetical protein DP112_04440 [Streptococcus suis]MCK3868275.1 hypothetical protein [Streptococcus suis]MCK3976548.1 hypothetical protein [Streptococcus suis]MDW8575319.1 hypothetical protein [Streptococcus suis]MDW8589399.1 hypothetical protein [Streptococcus suis]
MFNLLNKKAEVSKVAEYWNDTLIERGILSADELLEGKCWRCKSSHGVAVCQIVSSKWSKDTSLANQMVLCLSCQHEKPNVADTEIVWQWLEVENNERYWTLQGMAEYEKMYKKSVLQELWDMGIRDGEEVEMLVNKVTSLSRKNDIVLNRATLAGLFRCEIEQMRRKAFLNWTGIFKLVS